MKQALTNIILISSLFVATVANANDFLDRVNPSNIYTKSNPLSVSISETKSKPVYSLEYRVSSYHNGTITTVAKGFTEVDESGDFSFAVKNDVSYVGAAKTDEVGKTTVSPLTVSDGFSFEGQILDLGQEGKINLSSSFELNHVKVINSTRVNGVEVQTPDIINFEKGTSTNIPLDKETTVWNTGKSIWTTSEPVKELEDSPTQYKLEVTVKKI